MVVRPNYLPRLVPSVLAASRLDPWGAIAPLFLGRRVPWIHWDAMDGRFAPNVGLDSGTLGSLRKKFLERGAGCPKFAVHLMVERPDLRWEAFRGAGAESIVFHGECAVDGHALAQKIHGAGLLVGVAINPRTPLESCMPLLDAVDWVIFMGVEPGFCGQKFQDSVLEKISLAHRRRREQKFSFAIGVDGGVCAENIPRLLDAGTDIFIAGSGIFHSPNPSVAYDHLSNLLRRNGTKDAPPRLD